MKTPEIEKRLPPSESLHTTEAVSQKKASNLDTRCSDVCTRAGLTALLFSALAISMLQPLMKQPTFDALERYIALRFLLKSSLDDLEADPCWQDLKSNAQDDEALNKWNLSKLLDYSCSSKPKKADTELKRAGPPSEQPSVESSTSPSRPAAPTNLRIIYPFYTIQQIASILIQIGDDDLLTLAHSSSAHFQYSIYNWQRLRYNIIAVKLNIPVAWYTSAEEPVKKQDLNHTRHVLLQNLSILDVKRLADFELPAFSGVELPVAEQRRFNFSPTTPTLTLLSATMFVEIVSLLSLTYFWLFQCEAKLSETFPAAGTVFSVFARTTLSRYIFFMLTITPMVSAGLLAYYSFHKAHWNCIPAFFVGVISCLIFYEARIGSKHSAGKLYSITMASPIAENAPSAPNSPASTC